MLPVPFELHQYTLGAVTIPLVERRPKPNYSRRAAGFGLVDYKGGIR
jgi:hypothetical protein